MGLYKATFFFEHGKYGWSESFFTLQGDNALRTVLNSAFHLAQNRVRLLATDVQLTFIRVSDESKDRDSLVSPIGLFGPGKRPIATIVELKDISRTTTPEIKNPTVSSNAFYCDESYTGLMVRLDTDSGQRRMLILRGIPDVVTMERLRYEKLDWYVDHVNAFLQALLPPNGPWVINARTHAAGNNKVKITGMQGTHPIVIETANPHGLSDLDDNGRPLRVHITGSAGTCQPRGYFQVRVTDATHFEVEAACFPEVTYDGKSYFRRIVMGTGAVTRATVLRMVKRNTGRPSVLPRGRRSTPRGRCCRRVGQ